MLSQLEARLDLSRRFKIGVRDLAEAFRKCELPMDKFEMSVEHAALNADGDGGSGLRNPGRWLIKRLSAGYEHEPAGFKSWEERQERAILEDTQKRVQRLRRLQQQRFEAEFEEHLLNLSTGDKQQLLRESQEGQFFAERPQSAMATGQLRRLFAETTERLHLLDDGEVQNASSA